MARPTDLSLLAACGAAPGTGLSELAGAGREGTPLNAVCAEAVLSGLPLQPSQEGDTCAGKKTCMASPHTVIFF